MIVIDNYSKPIYIVFDYCEKIKNFKYRDCANLYPYKKAILK